MNGSKETRELALPSDFGSVSYSGLYNWLLNEQLFSNLPWELRKEGMSLKGLEIRPTSEDHPRLEIISNSLKYLYWPEQGLNSGDSPKELILQALVGTKFHPFNPGGQGPQILKDSQKEAIRVIESFRDRGLDRLLLVAPPGFGKTEVAIEFLAQSESGSSGLTLIVTDRVLNVTGFSQSLEMRNIDHSLWRSKSEESPDLRKVISKSRESKKYVVTTTATLRNQFKKLSEKERRELAEQLNLIVYDESQHLGAPLMRDFLSDLSSRDEFSGFILGLTATPVHRDISIQEMFYNQSYWVHLDSPVDLIDQNEFRERSVSDVVEQLYQTFSKGELTPFNQLFFLSEEILDIKNLFIQGENELGVASGQYVLNPSHYEYIALFLKSLIQNKNKVLVVSNSIREAESLSKVFNSVFPEFFVDYIHSKKDSETNLEVLESFEKSNKGIIVSVRMLDEGVNLTDLDLLIDLNSTASVTQFLQRLGRLLRLSEKKNWVEAVSLVEINEYTASELLILMNELKSINQPQSNGRHSLERRYPEVSMIGLNHDILAQNSWSQLESSIQQFWNKRKAKWCSFNEARDWARGSGIKSRDEWMEASKKGQLPDGIPGSPRFVYAGEFVGWGDWLGTGTGRISRQRTQSLPFEKAREWARGSGIKTSTEWMEASKKGQLPDGIPSNPRSVYAGEFVSWGDWTGTGRISHKGTQWLPFEKAREWARGSGIKTSTEWMEASKRDQLPDGIPSNPHTVYAGEFVSWGDWTGTGRISRKGTQWLPFEAAREWARGSGIKTSTEWKEVSKKGLLPDGIPGNPQSLYAGEFVSWKDWLGTEWLPFEAAREWARGSGIKTEPKWKEFSKKGQLPDGIPSDPRTVYAGEFVSWGDWLGK